MNVESFWLKQSKLVNWYKKPSYAFKRKNNNYFEWYPDGKLNVYYNCIGKNLELGHGNKIAIYFVNKKKQFSSYTYNQISQQLYNRNQ